MIDDLDLRPWTGKDWWHAVLCAGCDLQAELQEHARRRFHRERFRCGGCSGYATHVEIDPNEVFWDAYVPPEELPEPQVPLCDRCTTRDAVPQFIGSGVSGNPYHLVPPKHWKWIHEKPPPRRTRRTRREVEKRAERLALGVDEVMS